MSKLTRRGVNEKNKEINIEDFNERVIKKLIWSSHYQPLMIKSYFNSKPLLGGQKQVISAV